MPILPQIPPELLYALAAAACVALATAGLLGIASARARAAADALGRLRGELAALRHENGSQSATLLSLAARLDALQRQLTTDARHAATPAATSGGSAFELAIRLARGGATTEELMSACMMSRHEAELAIRLHGATNRGGQGRLAAVRQA